MRPAFLSRSRPDFADCIRIHGCDSQADDQVRPRRMPSIGGREPAATMPTFASTSFLAERKAALASLSPWCLEAASRSAQIRLIASAPSPVTDSANGCGRTASRNLSNADVVRPPA